MQGGEGGKEREGGREREGERWREGGGREREREREREVRQHVNGSTVLNHRYVFVQTACRCTYTFLHTIYIYACRAGQRPIVRSLHMCSTYRVLT